MADRDAWNDIITPMFEEGQSDRVFEGRYAIVLPPGSTAHKNDDGSITLSYPKPVPEETNVQ